MTVEAEAAMVPDGAYGTKPPTARNPVTADKTSLPGTRQRVTVGDG